MRLLRTFQATSIRSLARVWTTRGLPVLFFLVGSAGMAGSVWESGRFLPDDPISRDEDTLPAHRPADRSLSQIADFLESTFLRRPEGPIPASENVNTLGEVPDSSWFTNRIGNRAMTIKELVQGPNRGPGPDLTSPLTVVRAKTEGVTPGFTVRDSRGDLYFVKFDPHNQPQLSTSAEVVATKFFHAIGYHVPENHLVRIRPDGLRIAAAAKLTDDDGKTRQMAPHDILELLRHVPHRGDGTVQALASLALEGSPVGPFQYFGTRGDDPNDIFPHQNRRELRGLRVFAAWLNHDDARGINTLDTFIAMGDLGHLRHHLIDFGSCFGSGSVQVQSRRAGNEYLLEWGPILRSAASFGLIDRPWRRIPYPDLPGVGRFEAQHFRPEAWKPEYPNPAFDRMRLEDAFWATRIVQQFSDEMISAMVQTGLYEDSRSEAYLTKTLIERRDRIVRHYFGLLNPLSDFAISGSTLAFRNRGVEAGLAGGPEYQYQWFRYDNASGETTELGPPATVGSTSVPIPSSDTAFLMVRLGSPLAPLAPWRNPIDVFLRAGSPPKVVGIDRRIPENGSAPVRDLSRR